MLQTSSNQRDSRRLSRASVTNVVNLSPKTAIFSEKALGLTTFVTTGQKATQKTPWIDDVCNQTQPSHRSTPQPHWCGGRQRIRRAWLQCPWAAAGPGRASRRRAEPKARGADGSRAGRRPRGHQAARPTRQATRRPEHPWVHKQQPGKTKTADPQGICGFVVREGGVEPPLHHWNTDLNRARLPIPPLARTQKE